MKRAILFVGVVGLISLSSCKKDYTCTYDSPIEGQPDIVLDYNGLDKDEAKAAESACKLVSGTWAKK